MPHYIEAQQLLNHFEYLSSDQLQGRKFSSQASFKAQQYLIDQLKIMGIQPYNSSYRHAFEVKKLKKNVIGHNIIGFIPASIDTNSYIVLTAHYDHIGMKAGRIFNGADDNASGVSALLSIAKSLTYVSMQHNILLLFTDAEEAGLKGSKAFVTQNASLIKNIKLNINLDMLAVDKTSKRLYFLPSQLDEILTGAQLKQFYNLQASYQLHVIKYFRGIKNRKVNWLKASDHFSFHQKNIPFIYFGVGIHQNYHSPEDKFSQTNHQLLLNSSNFIFHNILYFYQNINVGHKS